MNVIVTFITVLATISGLVSAFILAGRIYFRCGGYSELERVIDECRGHSYSFPLLLPTIVFCVSWAWVVAVMVEST